MKGVNVGKHLTKKFLITVLLIAICLGVMYANVRVVGQFLSEEYCYDLFEKTICGPIKSSKILRFLDFNPDNLYYFQECGLFEIFRDSINPAAIASQIPAGSLGEGIQLELPEKYRNCSLVEFISSELRYRKELKADQKKIETEPVERLDVDESLETSTAPEQKNTEDTVADPVPQAQPLTARDYFPEANTPYWFYGKVVGKSDEGQGEVYDMIITGTLPSRVAIDNLPLKVKSKVKKLGVGIDYILAIEYDSILETYYVTRIASQTIYD